MMNQDFTREPIMQSQQFSLGSKAVRNFKPKSIK